MEEILDVVRDAVEGPIVSYSYLSHIYLNANIRTRQDFQGQRSAEQLTNYGLAAVGVRNSCMSSFLIFFKLTS